MKKILSHITALSLYNGQAYAAYNLNLPTPATPIALQIYDLHNLILIVCLFIFILVFVFMFYALFKHRKSTGHQAVQFHNNTKLEIVWTIIPFFILIGIAFPTTKTVLAMKNVEHADMNIKATGHQWVWEYEYLGEGVNFISNLSTTQDQINNKVVKGPHYLLEVDKPLVVPTGKKIRILLTSTDVIHSWWLPEFGVKQDAVPGFIHEVWFQVDKPGIYRGQCAELCGIGHGYMPIVVEAMPPEQYTGWLQVQKATLAEAATTGAKIYTLDELKTEGEKVYLSRCAICHQANGLGVAGVFPSLVEGSAFSAAPEVTSPLAKRGFWKDGKIVMGTKNEHLDIVMHGIPGTAMQGIGLQLTDLEVAAVVSYERNSWGNTTGDVVQPAEAAAIRKKGAPS
ncbi:MAG TPA: cytochrome c oxidase subunit II [Methylotenera sp.]|nr:cytochrome c oxidase subunit II [Methylotenera sp.]